MVRVVALLQLEHHILTQMLLEEYMVYYVKVIFFDMELIDCPLFLK